MTGRPSFLAARPAVFGRRRFRSAYARRTASTGCSKTRASSWRPWPGAVSGMSGRAIGVPVEGLDRAGEAFRLDREQVRAETYADADAGCTRLRLGECDLARAAPCTKAVPAAPSRARRQAAGATPMRRLNARLKATSD